MPIYRYMKCEEHAEQLASGVVYLSTLETCRGYEDAQRGDKEEACEKYFNPGVIYGDGDNPDLVLQAERLGIHVDSSSIGIRLVGGERISRLEDAYVLCTTLGFSEENLTDSFGKYCVEISQIDRFAELIGIALNDKVRWVQCGYGPVAYRDRSFTGLEPAPGIIGFVKPADLYSDQKEFRFIWTVPQGLKIAPLAIQCPEIASLVRRIA